MGNLARVVDEEVLVCGQRGDANGGERATAIRHNAHFCRFLPFLGFNCQP